MLFIVLIYISSGPLVEMLASDKILFASTIKNEPSAFLVVLKMLNYLEAHTYLKR